jgi:hypothetical protein
MDTPEQPNPMLWHQGQPISQEGAVAALAAFDADEVKVKAALGGDISAQAERRDLWMLARGHQPGAAPVMPSDGHGVHEQMADREEQIVEARLDTFAKHMRMGPEQRGQQRRWLATQEQHDFAVAEKARLLKDPDFRAKVFAGHADETSRWIGVCQAAAAQIAPPDYDWSKDKF